AYLHIFYGLSTRGSPDVPARHPASFRRVAVLGEDPADLRHQEARLDLGADHADHAAAGPDADDRRLSPHARHANRRRHLLRHAMHHARAGAALPDAVAAAEGF